MKAAGIVLAIVGALMVISSIRLAITKYDFHSAHDISTFSGGLVVSVLVLLGGIALYRKANGPNMEDQRSDRESGGGVRHRRQIRSWNWFGGIVGLIAIFILALWRMGRFDWFIHGMLLCAMFIYAIIGIKLLRKERAVTDGKE